MMRWLRQFWCGLFDHAGIGNLHREMDAYYGNCKVCGKRVKM